jgi:hypothetical protein
MIPEISGDGRPSWGWPQALDYYRERTGIDVSPERIAYYTVVNGLLGFLYSHHSAHLIHEGRTTDLRFLWTAWEVSYRSQYRLAREFGFAPATELSMP